VKLIKATGNQWVCKFYDSINLSLARYQFMCLHIPGLTSRSCEMHGEILDLIRDGRFDRAKEVLISHIHMTTRYIEERIERHGNQ
jgi:DNA-binding GntR family transcriptional regulator